MSGVICRRCGRLLERPAVDAMLVDGCRWCSSSFSDVPNATLDLGIERESTVGTNNFALFFEEFTGLCRPEGEAS